jgi:hypothetical protein
VKGLELALLLLMEELDVEEEEEEDGEGSMERTGANDTEEERSEDYMV